MLLDSWLRILLIIYLMVMIIFFYFLVALCSIVASLDVKVGIWTFISKNELFLK